MRSLFLAFVLTACGASTSLDAGIEDTGMDDSSIDSGVDSDVPDSRIVIDGGGDVSLDVPAADCTAHEFLGCSDSVYHWFWNGSDCELVFECSGMGDVSRRACLDAHAGCGGPDRCSAMAAEEIVIACPELPGYGWDGSGCTRIHCCAGPDCNGLFASEAECTAEYTSCGIEDTCGPEFVLGHNEAPALRIDEAAPSASRCLVTPGDAWLARGVFSAPADGRYGIEAHPAIAFGGSTDIAIFNGRCTDEGRSCFSGEGGGGAGVWLRAGDLITILVKPEYTPRDGDPEAFFTRIDVEITLDEE